MPVVPAPPFFPDATQQCGWLLAGGAVRDLLMGRSLRDADYAFCASEQEFIRRNPSACKVRSASCPTFILNGQEFTQLAGNSFEEDLLRRDFTINALLLSEEGVLYAHPHALCDLKQRCIRPASPTALADDPVRIYRAARFTATLQEFTLHGDTCAQARQVIQQGKHHEIAAEQITKEFLKASLGDVPGNFLRALEQEKAFDYWFEAFCEAAAIPAGPAQYHTASVLEHTAQVMDGVAALAKATSANEPCQSLAVWMALCHDIGKTATDTALLPRHFAHDVAGEALARALGTRLKMPRKFIEAGRLAAKLHMKAGQYNASRSGTKVDLLTTLHAAHLLEPFFLLASVDAGLPDLPQQLRHDVACILAVSLPEKWQNKGEDSARQLRELRCTALKERRKL